MVLVNDNIELRAKQTQKNNQYFPVLDQELEESLALLIEMELNYHIQVERMKRELEQMRGFSTVAAFRLMDIKNFNYIDWESIMIFLKNNAKGSRKREQPTKQKINAIFRRLDTNADTRLGFSEFAEAIKPVDVYFTDIHQAFKKEQDINEQKRMTEMQMQQLKKELALDVSDLRTQLNYKPLRTFHAMNNPALREEMTSPALKVKQFMLQHDDGSRDDAPQYNNGDLDLSQNKHD